MMNKLKAEYEIAVVGAGVVGSVAALLLAKAGYNILILDLAAEPEAKYLVNNNLEQINTLLPPDLRMSAITLKSEEILAELGIWPEVLKRSGTMQQTHVWEEDGPGSITFDSLAIGSTHLSTIVENNYLQELLTHQLKLNSNITLVRPCKVLEIKQKQYQVNNQNKSFDIITEQQTFKVNLIIGADGARSWVRDYFDFVCEEQNYNHYALVANVYTEKPHKNTAYQHFRKEGPLAFLPWAEPHCCSIVWSQSKDKAEFFNSCSPEDFHQGLEKAFNSTLGKITDSSKRVIFPLTMRHAEKYYKTGVVLLGDAAHTIHPLAGQGMNLGIYDAFSLAETLSHAKEKNQNYASDVVLLKYQLKRRGHNEQMIQAMQAFKDIYSTDKKSVKLIRSVGMNLVNNLSLLKNPAMRFAAGFY